MTTARTPPNSPRRAAGVLRELRELEPKRRLERLRDAPISASGNGAGEVTALEAKLLLLIEEAGRLTMVSAAEALEATAFTVELADESAVDLARTRARRARARALAYSGRFDEALVACSEAISIGSRCGLLEEVGRARLASMHALTEMGRLHEAIDAGLAARATFETLDEPALAARADNNLGIVFQRRDEPAAAIECFDRARPVLQSEPVALGHLENSRGEALLALNKFGEAEAAFLAALEAFDQADATLTAAIAEGNLGDLAMRRGRLQEAMRYFERARRRLEKSESPGHLARLIAEQAEAKAMMGLTTEALMEYEQALTKLEKCGMPLEAARARSAMGMALFRAGRPAQAETALAAAAVAFEEMHHATSRARVDLVRAELAARSGRVRDARTIALRALAVLDSRPVDAAAARHVLGRLAMQMGELELAESELRAAAGLAETLGIPSMQCEIHHSLGRLHRACGRRDEAIANLSLASECADRVRATIQAERFRTAFLGDRAALHEELVTCLLDSADASSIVQAFEVAERCKSRTLVDRLLAAETRSDAKQRDADADPSDRDLLGRMRELHEDLNALYSRLHDERFAAQSAAGLQSWRTRVRELEGELSDIESRLASARGAAALHAPSARFEEVRAALRPAEAIIEYFSLGDELAAFVVAADRAPTAHRLPGIRGIEPRLERLQFQIDRALRRESVGRTDERLLADARRELGALYAHLIEPLEPAIEGFSDLIVVPHGVLHALPFHALWDGQRYLDERYTMRTAPSAGVLARLSRLTERETGMEGRALVVAVADEVVPDIVREGDEVASLLGGTLLQGEAATIAHVRAAAPHATVVHFACHGRFDASTPHSSGLLLADGWMTIRDVYALRLDADLIFLSACETGLNHIESGDELLGMERAFLATGARGMILTLWRVADEIAADFGRRFYMTWHTDSEKQPGIAAAAQLARAAIREQHPHPAAWAPFVVAGGVTACV